MKTSKLFILFPALLWIIVKYLVYRYGYQNEAFNYMVALNLLFLLFIIFMEIYLTNRENAKDAFFLSDVKKGLKAAAYYIIIIGVFTFSYLKWIDPGMQQSRIDAQMEMVEQSLDENYEEIVAGNEQLKGKSKEEIINDKREEIESFLSPKFQTIGGTLLLLIASIFFSITSTLLVRKVLLS